jgi:hypothetical protein
MTTTRGHEHVPAEQQLRVFHAAALELERYQPFDCGRPIASTKEEAL